MSTEVFGITKTSAESVFIIIVTIIIHNTCIKALDTKMCLLHIVLHVIYSQGTNV